MLIMYVDNSFILYICVYFVGISMVFDVGLFPL